MQAICSSYVEEDKRCTLPTVPGSKHCIAHRGSAYRSYKKYKHAQSVVDSKDHNSMLKSTDIKALLKYYSQLSRVYKGRLYHQAAMFCESERDRGHAAKIKSLERMLRSVESRLECLFAQHDAECVAETSETSTEEDCEEEPSPTPQEPCDTYADLKKETDRMIEKYAAETRQHYNTLFILKCRVLDSLAKLGLPCRSMEDVYVICSVVSALMKFNQFGYFDSNVKCKDTERTYRDPATTFIPLTDSDIQFPLVSLSEDQLKSMYLIILTKPDLVKAVMCSVVSYYFHFATVDILRFSFKVVWNEDINDLSLAIFTGDTPSAKFVVDTIRIMSENGCRLRQRVGLADVNPPVFLATSQGVLIICPEIMTYMCELLNV